MKSPEAQAILDEMKPLGEWLMAARPMTRALGRTQYAKDHGEDGLASFDREYNQKDLKFRKLEAKYRTLRKKEQSWEHL